jgi:hypothetical protein
MVPRPSRGPRLSPACQGVGGERFRPSQREAHLTARACAASRSTVFDAKRGSWVTWIAFFSYNEGSAEGSPSPESRMRDT